MENVVKNQFDVLIENITSVEFAIGQSNKLHITGTFNYMAEFKASFEAQKKGGLNKGDYTKLVAEKLAENNVKGLSKGRIQNLNKLLTYGLDKCLEFDSVDEILADGVKKKAKKEDFSEEVELFKNSAEAQSFMNFLEESGINQNVVSKIFKQYSETE